MNRPGEAVQEFNESIRKNDNRAVFRTRLMLDRDLAVRNADLARAYDELDLQRWLFSKAAAAVRHDPFSASARLFLSEAFEASGQRLAADRTELLLYRLLSPANQNTFSLATDYTPLFEAPYLRGVLSGSIGAWENGETIGRGETEVYGGVPGWAGDIVSRYTFDNGYRDRNDFDRDVFSLGQVKWDASPADSFFASYTVGYSETGDLRRSSEFDYLTSPYFLSHRDSALLEVGWTHRFSPEATFIAYGSYSHARFSFEDRFFDSTLDEATGRTVETGLALNLDNPFEKFSFQAQQQLSFMDTPLGDHRLMAGVEFVEGHTRYRDEANFFVAQGGQLLDAEYEAQELQTPDRGVGLYVIDYWRLARTVVAELQLAWQRVEAARPGFGDPIEKSQLSPRAGVSWEATPQDTFRIAVQHYLAAPLATDSIQPASTAGFPGGLSIDPGGRVTEAALAWEREWNAKTFSLIQLEHQRYVDFQYETDLGYDREVALGTNAWRGLAVVERILTPWLGARVFGVAARIDPDDDTARRDPETDFLFLGLGGGFAISHETGLRFEATGIGVHQHFYDGRAENPTGAPRDDADFFILDLRLAYEFPNKLGFVALDVDNVFDARFNFQTERSQILGTSFTPARRVAFIWALYL